jgi:hypothetical protein
MIEPVVSLQARVVNGVQMPPRAVTMDHFDFVESDDRLGRCVVIVIPDAAHRRLSLHCEACSASAPNTNRPARFRVSREHLFHVLINSILSRNGVLYVTVGRGSSSPDT